METTGPDYSGIIHVLYTGFSQYCYMCPWVLDKMSERYCRKGTVLFLLDVAPMPRYSINVIFSGPLRKVPAETLNSERVRLAAPCLQGVWIPAA